MSDNVSEQSDSIPPEDTDANNENDQKNQSFAAEAAAIASGDGATTPEVIDIGNEGNTDDGSSTSAGPDLSHIDLDDLDAGWLEYFPFDEPYEQQVDAIDRCLDTIGKGGYQMLEGACGTGKTLIALISCLELIENYDTHVSEAGPEARLSTEPERVFAVTSVKQQLRQFIEEVRAINGSIAEDDDTERSQVQGLVLRGKSDMIPYAQADNGPFGEGTSTQRATTDLRDRTYDLIKKESNVTLDWPSDLVEHCETDGCMNHVQGDAICSEHGSEEDRDDSDRWYDPARAKAVATRASEIDGDRLEIDDIETPYPETVPHTTEVADQTVDTAVPINAQGRFDPFYAGFFAGEKRVPFHFDAGEGNVLDSRTLLRESSESGICPHSAMRKLMERSDVLLGNFYHLFDPETRHLTEEYLTEETLVVVDEAHNLEERVRDALSDSVSMHGLRQAHQDIMTAREYYTGSHQSDLQNKPSEDARQQAQQAVSSLRGSVSSADFEEALAFLEWLMGRLDQEVSEYLDDEYGDWRRARSNGQLDRYDQEIPLQDPESDDPDSVFLDAVNAEKEFDGGEIWYDIEPIALAAVAIHEMVDESDRTPIVDGLANTLKQWRTETHIEYFREVALEYSPKESVDSSLPDWTKAFNASYYLFNCIPSGKLAAIFEDLGGGILMSATLNPFDVYSEVSGLHALDTGSVRAMDDQGPAGVSSGGEPTAPPRVVEEVQYGLAFPEENRASYVVDVPKFTYRNRGTPTQSYGSMTPVRQTYADVLTGIGQGYGNTLICLPSYSEAKWTAGILEASDAVEKPVLLDKSSGSAFTDDLLAEFFGDDHSVLITSLRGTVTEGIDYKGERLHSCAVVGVPYINTKSPQTQAVMTAYDRSLETGGDGFEAAIKVPAVRKARQAIGRVLRGPEEVGTRILVDGRYLPGKDRAVHQYLGAAEQQEFEAVRPDSLRERVEGFWDGVDTN